MRFQESDCRYRGQSIRSLGLQKQGDRRLMGLILISSKHKIPVGRDVGGRKLMTHTTSQRLMDTRFYTLYNRFGMVKGRTRGQFQVDLHLIFRTPWNKRCSHLRNE